MTEDTVYADGFEVRNAWSLGDSTSIPNELLQDGGLSLVSKGIYGLMRSSRPGTKWSAGKIESLAPEGRRVVSAALRELKEAGWVTFKQVPTGVSTRPFLPVYTTHATKAVNPQSGDSSG